MWPAALTEQLHRLAVDPNDDGLRRVLADALTEAESPWGELLSLEVAGTDLARRRALEAALAKSLTPLLLRGADTLHFERGLPVWALLNTDRFRAEQPVPWPWRRLTLYGEFRSVLGVLRHPLAAHLEVLDLSPLYATSPFSLWVGGPPAPLPPLPALHTLHLPQGTLAAHWHPILLPAFRHVRTLVVGLGPTDVLEDWPLELPGVERLVLEPRREPVNEDSVERARRWALARPGRALELFERTVSPTDAVHALRPALPAAHWEEPEAPTLKLDTQTDGAQSRLERAAARAFFKTHDTPAQDFLVAPRNPRLVRALGTVFLRRQVHVELEAVPPPLPLRAPSPTVAAGWARALVDALTSWWRLGPPDVLLGEWVAVGRDQLRLGADGLPQLVPALTRRAGPDVHGVPDFAGLPFRWTDVGPMTTRLAAALTFEWLTGLPLLAADDAGARATHAALQRTLRQPPRPSEALPTLRPFDALLTQALREPWTVEPLDFVAAFERAATEAGP